MRSDSSIGLYLREETPKGTEESESSATTSVGAEGRLGSGGTWALLTVHPITFPDF